MVAATLEDVYASALVELAEETACREEVVDDAAATATLLRAHPELVAAVVDPRRTTGEALDLLAATIDDRVHPHLRRLLEVLVERGRFAAVLSILERVGVLDRERRGILTVEVTTAVPLEAAVRDRVAAGIRRRLGPLADCRFAVDPDIVGGLVLRYRDRRVDLSVRRRAAEMIDRLRRMPVRVAWTDDEETDGDKGDGP